MSVLNVKPEFLYPTSRQFPFDKVAEKIVRALESRNWKVPGITVKFDIYGSGEAKYKMVREILGNNFKMYFERSQGRLPGNVLNDMAALHKVYIPEQGIEVYEDESGPTYYLYVGQNWDKEKEWFMNSIKVHSKLREEPRRYLRYSGRMYKQRPLELVHDNDLGREYSPEGNEPKSFNLEEKLKEFTVWLDKYVLKYILLFPEKNVKEEVSIELIPYNGPWKTIYSLCCSEEAERIIQGNKNPKELPAHKRHAFFGSGRRLVSLDVPNNGRFPAIAYEGFIWCDIESTISRAVATEMKSFFSADNNIVCIKLKYANDVYVVDHALYEETRKQLFQDIAPCVRLTDEQFCEVLAARAATIIPITEYKGDYKQPIVLIARELDFDEVDAICCVE